MSASREKQLRREQRAEGTEKRQVAKKNTARKTKRNRVIGTIVAIVVVIALIAVIILNSNFFYTQATALRIADESYTTAEFNYYYFNSYYSFANSYGDYLSYFLDTTQPLESQQYSEDQTWADYFQEQAIETMRQTQMLCDKAKQAGFTLPEEYQDIIDGLSGKEASLGAAEAFANDVTAKREVIKEAGGDIAAFGRRYNPRNAAKWTASVESLIEARKKNLDATGGLNRFSNTCAQLRKTTGTDPVKWAEEADFKEVAKVSWKGEEVVLLRPAKPFVSHNVRFNTHRGFVTTLFGQAYALTDDSHAACIGNWLIMGSQDAVKHFMSSEARQKLHYWPSKGVKAIVLADDCQVSWTRSELKFDVYRTY